MNFRQSSNLCGVFTIRLDDNQQREGRATGIFDDLKHFFFWIKPLSRSCMCVLFISNMFFFSFVVVALCSSAGCFLANCGRVSSEKWTFDCLMYEWNTTNEGWCDFVCFFYSVDVGHNKMSGTITFWSCCDFSCMLRFESAEIFQIYIKWMVTLVSYGH